jgi:hypothetical protein
MSIKNKRAKKKISADIDLFTYDEVCKICDATQMSLSNFINLCLGAMINMYDTKNYLEFKEFSHLRALANKDKTIGNLICDAVKVYSRLREVDLDSNTEDIVLALEDISNKLGNRSVPGIAQEFLTIALDHYNKGKISLKSKTTKR